MVESKKSSSQPVAESSSSGIFGPRPPRKGKEFKTLKQRQDAVKDGKVASKKDKTIDYLVKNIETDFWPKTVESSNDWLKEHKENGQPFKRYQEGGPDISWVSARHKTIYLLPIDSSIEPDVIASCTKYCEAFYTGCDVKLLQLGQTFEAKKKVPKDFLGHFKIASRMNDGLLQFHAGEIIQALKEVKPKDGFCLVAMTN